ncbi:bifunctional hydroxymethylpyrimidine kinase/phosphomethylpyrimidine kinase [Solibacillus sp. R5-41]|uniref:bifunctional hydroxymethylpyrimidine kinase/phosphomethylpyrimidine kinase n=1 Tax=Solibacillus sp. R5-41 TaxID=2048654 RepID=UPI000C12629A|nr:bifunctional hydroxymethylpyrimidine kinase/phosphomethylpyrimidine kinase [Solibacillus sp. R5-41]ATP39172.1 bifunctional hydroxymethylpyrimidine kinase/phosphomethylpyrimidine kinase [Solibacillus sp. R5-41]
MNIVMTIAGSDSSGGAGIQADLKTFQELGVYGTTVITALTAQNTIGVSNIFPTPPGFIQAQMEAVFADLPVTALKTGMLFSADIIETVAEVLQKMDVQLVVDPVMIAKGGASLLQREAVEALKTKLLPLATVLTPNIPEAEVITGMTITTPTDIQVAAQQILRQGVQCVVMKGGHLEGTEAVDTVFFQDGSTFSLSSKRIHTRHTHGTGCTFSAAVTAFLGKGYAVRDAIIEAKRFIQAAIENPLNIGNGNGPTNHFAYKQISSKGEVQLVETT